MNRFLKNGPVGLKQSHEKSAAGYSAFRIFGGLFLGLSFRFEDDFSLCFRDIHDDFSGSGNADQSAQGILDAQNRSVQGGHDFRTFKGKVGIFHYAVDQAQVFAVAKWLRANDGAVFKGHVLGIPGEVFPLDDAVLDQNVPSMPQAVLGIQVTVIEYGVFHILERVLSFQRNIVEYQIFAAHHEILGFKGTVGKFASGCGPAEFGGNDSAVLHADIRTFSQCLDASEFRVEDAYACGIPQ